MTHQEKQKAFVAMIKQHERLILKVCALYTNSCRSELSDLYQDAVCAMWESYDSFKGQSKPSTWIYSVTRYTMINASRRRRLETTAMSNIDAESIAAEGSDSDVLDELRQAVAALPPDDRDVFVMWMEGFNPGEIGEALGLSYGTVATRITRIKIKLRRLLKDYKEVVR
ncbi:MAG: sigma-70 family RNA polymerase sigma factor [Bacteroidales bacterium]|nr:sigma-70 family RNA polymerase sigma factor [Bacteroidales bacterium]MBR6330565.1 sigma-70 family RNA polymerase sigma factor [Bacteroidales bacterium]